METLLEEVARRGSWLGGGSVAALAIALAAALLEKLLLKPRARAQLRQIRQRGLRFVEQDGIVFARVIAATRQGRRAPFARALRAANDIPCRIFADAHMVLALTREARRQVKPRFQSDLKCAAALATAAAAGARALISTNVAWMADAAYTARIRRQLQRAAGHAR